MTITNANGQPAEPGTQSREDVVVTPEEALNLAIGLHKSGRREPAERIYRDILAHEPDNWLALQFLGVACHQAGNSDEALAHLRRALDIETGDAGLWLNYGNVLVESEQAEEAVPAYRRAAELNPNNPQPFNNVGVALRALGRPSLAEEAFRSAIALAPDDPNAYHNLGNLLIGVGRPQEAIEFGLRALTLMPDKIERGMLGAAYTHLGDYDNARAMYRKWLEEDPDNPLAAHYLAALGETPPERASDAYVEATFDSFASSFDAKLAYLEYRAPNFCAEALAAAIGERRGLDILDAGCGTGLCGPLLKPFAARLSGIDLSAKMLGRAKARGVYDRVRKAEIVAFLDSIDEMYDAIVSADTLCYFGPLEAFAHGAARVLRPGGILVATFEAAADPEVYEISHTGRYRHGHEYLSRTMEEAGIPVRSLDAAVLRTEQARPVDGWVLTAQR